MFGGELNYQVSPVRTEKKWQTKLGASNPTPSTDSVIASLEQMLMKPPMKVDLQEMEELLNAVEALGTPAAKGVVKRGLEKLEYARRAQVAARAAKVAEQIKQLMEPPPMEIDQEALLAALEVAADTPAFDEKLLERGEASLRKAEEAWEQYRAERRQAAEAAIERAVAPPLPLLDPDAIKVAIEHGEEVEADADVLQDAHDRLRAAMRREAAARRLEFLRVDTASRLTSLEIDEVDSSAMLAAIKEGARAGVAMATVELVQTLVRETERARASRNAAAALLKGMVAPSDLEVDLEAADEALVDAEEAEVADAAIEVSTSEHLRQEL